MKVDKLILTDGDVIDHAQIKEELQLWVAGESLKEIGFDPWSATQFSLALAEEGLPLVEVPQTVRNFSEAMEEVEALVYGGRFHHSDHPVMNWMMSNVTVKPDRNENIFPNRSTPEAKIDGPAALFTAMSRVLVNGGTDDNSISVFDVIGQDYWGEGVTAKRIAGALHSGEPCGADWSDSVGPAGCCNGSGSLPG